MDVDKGCIGVVGGFMGVQRSFCGGFPDFTGAYMRLQGFCICL